jgi:hypothetical protein
MIFGYNVTEKPHWIQRIRIWRWIISFYDKEKIEEKGAIPERKAKDL